MPEVEIRNLIEGDNGAILISMPGGIRQLLDGKVDPYLLPAGWPQFKPESLLRDRDGGCPRATGKSIHSLDPQA